MRNPKSVLVRGGSVVFTQTQFRSRALVNLIELTWTAYARLLVPAPKGSIQYEESRKAFYAGAQTVMDACKKIGEPGVSEEAGEMVLMLIEQELAAFSDAMTKKAKDKTEAN